MKSFIAALVILVILSALILVTSGVLRHSGEEIYASIEVLSRDRSNCFSEQNLILAKNAANAWKNKMPLFEFGVEREYVETVSLAFADLLAHIEGKDYAQYLQAVAHLEEGVSILVEMNTLSLSQVF